MRCYDYLYIDGRWAAPSGTGTITVISPDTGELIGTMPWAQKADLDAAVEAARHAVDNPAGWARLIPTARADALRRFADAIEERTAVSSRMISASAATLRPTEIPPQQLLRLYADVIENRRFADGGNACTAHRPIGAVGAIVPWGFPHTQAFMKIAPALAAGCAVVVKPTVVLTSHSDKIFDDTLLDYFVLAEAAIAANFPAGALNIVPGSVALGADLIADSRLDRIALTGYRSNVSADRQLGWISMLDKQVQQWTMTRPASSGMRWELA